MNNAKVLQRSPSILLAQNHSTTEHRNRKPSVDGTEGENARSVCVFIGRCSAGPIYVAFPSLVALDADFLVKIILPGWVETGMGQCHLILFSSSAFYYYQTNGPHTLARRAIGSLFYHMLQIFPFPVPHTVSDAMRVCMCFYHQFLRLFHSSNPRPVRYLFPHSFAFFLLRT